MFNEPSDNGCASLTASANTLDSSVSMVSFMVMQNVESNPAGLPSNSLRTTWGPEAEVVVGAVVVEWAGAT